MSATRRRILQAQNSAAAVHKLPNELLSEIFIESLRDYERWDINTLRYLAVISGICTRWRLVALSTPTLWSNVIYEEDILISAAPAARKRAKDRINTYLSRSKHSPIHIFIHISVSDVSVIPMNTIKTLFWPHMSRCRTLKLEFNAVTQLLAFFPLPGRLELLKSLRCFLAEPEGGKNAHLLHPLAIFSHEQNDARLNNFVFPSITTVSFTNLDPTQLTTISIEGYGDMWFQLFTLLSKATLLKRLSIDVAPPSMEDTAFLTALGVPQFTLPNLRSLTFSTIYLGTIMDMPNLRVSLSKRGIIMEGSSIQS